MSYRIIPLLFLFSFLFFSCPNNPSNSSNNNDEIEETINCEAIVDVIIRKELQTGVSNRWVVYFAFKIENIGEITIKSSKARYKFINPDYTTSTGTIDVHGFELPPGVTYTYNVDRLGVDYYPLQSGSTTIEISNISYSYVY